MAGIAYKKGAPGRTPNTRGLFNRGVGGAVDLDWWQEAPPLPGLSVTYVPAQHWSMRAP